MVMDNPIKIVAIGDGGVGKTCLLLVFAQGVFPQHYLPTVFENHNKEIVVDNRKVKLSLWDTAGQEEYARLRPMSYVEADVILLCCSVDLPDSLYNIKSQWLPEASHFCHSSVHFILVVNKIDLRNDETTIENLALSDQRPLQFEQCQQLAIEIHPAAFLECSASRHVGVQEIFQTAASLSMKNPRVQRKTKGDRNKCVIL